jgi:hypothetical protein
MSMGYCGSNSRKYHLKVGTDLEFVVELGDVVVVLGRDARRGGRTATADAVQQRNKRRSDVEAHLRGAVRVKVRLRDHFVDQQPTDAPDQHAHQRQQRLVRQRRILTIFYYTSLRIVLPPTKLGKVIAN